MFRFALLSLFAVACVTDDDTKTTGDTGDTTDTVTDTTDTQTDPAAAIQGDWVSAGDDVSALLQLFTFTQIDATFNADGSYTVSALNAAGQTSVFAGTYVVDTTTDPRGITLSQTAPLEGTSVGIWQVDADGVLSYEVVQTVPDIGATPPTPEGGFGSTVAAGVNTGDNVQIFRRPE